MDDATKPHRHDPPAATAAGPPLPAGPAAGEAGPAGRRNSIPQPRRPGPLTCSTWCTVRLYYRTPGPWYRKMGYSDELSQMSDWAIEPSSRHHNSYTIKCNLPIDRILMKRIVNWALTDKGHHFEVLVQIGVDEFILGIWTEKLFTVYIIVWSNYISFLQLYCFLRDVLCYARKSGIWQLKNLMTT